MLLFIALSLLGVAIAGATAFVIFWPLALVHIRDRHPALQSQLGEGAFARPAAWAWLLRGEYRAAGDVNLDGLATPAKVSLLTVIFSLLGSVALWALSSAISA